MRYTDTSQFGLDPRMHGYQQHGALVSAGPVDYVRYAQPINMTQVRASDEEAKEALPSSGHKACNWVKNDSPGL